MYVETEVAVTSWDATWTRSEWSTWYPLLHGWSMRTRRSLWRIHLGGGSDIGSDMGARRLFVCSAIVLVIVRMEGASLKGGRATTAICRLISHDNRQG